MINNFRILAAREGIELHIDIQNDLANVVTNVYETNKIISNLLQNAIDEVKTHKDKAYGIWLYIFKRGEFCNIHVANELEEDVPQEDYVKNIYKQGYTTKLGHDGIGLSSIQTLAKRHKGLIYTYLEGNIIHFIAEIPISI
jgi:sensor histidine kinase regulating citrate/malate metabolism